MPASLAFPTLAQRCTSVLVPVHLEQRNGQGLEKGTRRCGLGVGFKGSMQRHWSAILALSDTLLGQASLSLKRETPDSHQGGFLWPGSSGPDSGNIVR